MLEYKTTCIPAPPVHKGVPVKEFYKGLSVSTCNKVLAPIGASIEDEARGGWTLHSVQFFPVQVTRKKKILELLLGWIPFLGNWLFPMMKIECTEGATFGMYSLLYVKEV